MRMKYLFFILKHTESVISIIVLIIGMKSNGIVKNVDYMDYKC